MSRTFDGTAKVLSATADYFDGLTALLVIVRFRMTDITAQQLLVMKGDDSTGYSPAWALMLLGAPTNKIFFKVSSTSALNNAIISDLSGKCIEGVWYTVVVAWDGTTQKMWLSTGDSAVAASVVATMKADGATRFRIGSEAVGLRRFVGDIAEVMIETNGTFPTDAEVNEYLKSESKAFKPKATAHWVLGDDGSLTDILGSKVLAATGSPAVSSNHPVVWNPILARAGSDYFDGLSALLVATRFRPNDLSTELQWMVTKSKTSGVSVSTISWGIFLSPPANALRFYLTDGTTLGQITFSSMRSKISEGNWYTIVIAWDGTSFKAWLSTGDLATATALASMNADTSSRFVIGAPGSGTDRVFDGAIAEVMIEANGTFPTEARVQKLLDGQAWDENATNHWQILGDGQYHDIIGGKILDQPWPIKLPATRPHVYAPNKKERTKLQTGYLPSANSIRPSLSRR